MATKKKERVKEIAKLVKNLKNKAKKAIAKTFRLRLIDFNGMSIHEGLFYALRLGNCIHCMFIFTFLCSC